MAERYNLLLKHETIAYSKPLSDLAIILRGCDGHISENSIRKQNTALKHYDKIEKAEVTENSFCFVAKKTYANGDTVRTKLNINSFKQLHQSEREHAFKLFLFFLRKISKECNAGNGKMMNDEFTFKPQDLKKLGIFSETSEARSKLDKLLLVLCSVVLQQETINKKERKTSGVTTALFTSKLENDEYTIFLCKGVKDWNFLFGYFVPLPDPALKMNSMQLLIYLNAYHTCIYRRKHSVSYSLTDLLTLCFLNDSYKKKYSDKQKRKVINNVLNISEHIPDMQIDFDFSDNSFRFYFGGDLLEFPKRKTTKKSTKKQP